MKCEATPLVDARTVRPGNLPHVALRVSKSKSAAPRRVLQFIEVYHPFVARYRVMNRLDLAPIPTVDAQREAAESVSHRTKCPFVALGRIERHYHAVGALEDHMRRLARRSLRPAELPVEPRHQLHVVTEQRDEVEARRDRGSHAAIVGERE